MNTEPSNIRDLLAMPIDWQKCSDRPVWLCMIGEEECSLVMNDFPDEPLYTLRWRNQVWDFDDAPSCWVIPRA